MADIDEIGVIKSLEWIYPFDEQLEKAIMLNAIIHDTLKMVNNRRDDDDNAEMAQCRRECAVLSACNVITVLANVISKNNLWMNAVPSETCAIICAYKDYMDGVKQRRVYPVLVEYLKRNNGVPPSP
jgi:hypothetical protein